MSAGEVEAALSNFRDADDSDDKHRALSPALFVGALNFQLGSKADAIPYLARVTRSAQALPDKLLAKYDNDFHIELLLRGRIPIRLPLLARPSC